MTEHLLHFGQPMQWEPTNGSDEDLLWWFRERIGDSGLVHVQLEPGDATEYNLIISSVRSLRHMFNFDDDGAAMHVLVVVVRSGHPDTVALCGPLNYGYERQLYPTNDWAQVFLKWWIDTFLEKLSG